MNPCYYMLLPTNLKMKMSNCRLLTTLLPTNFLSLLLPSLNLQVKTILCLHAIVALRLNTFILSAYTIFEFVLDMTVLVIDQAISNEPKLLHATSHHSKNEDVKLTSVQDISSNEPPIVVITEPTCPGINNTLTS